MTAKNGPASSTTRSAGPEKSAATKQLASDLQSTAGDAVSLPLAWARQLIASAAGDVPEYGSPDWLVLPDDSRNKVAGCVVAAEQWRTRRKGVGTVDPLGYSLSEYPSRRRRIAEARRPRPQDHPGGPVPMWGPHE